MTKEEFFNIDWSDTHIGYDIQVGQHRTISYVSISAKYPDCLCLFAESKQHPAFKRGCGTGFLKNPTPYDIINILDKKSYINRIITIIDNVAYDLKPNVIHVNGIDELVLFDIIPFKVSEDNKLNIYSRERIKYYIITNDDWFIYADKYMDNIEKVCQIEDAVSYYTEYDIVKLFEKCIALGIECKIVRFNIEYNAVEEIKVIN